MVQDCVNCFLSSLNHIKYTVWKSCLLQQVCHKHRSTGVTFRRFEHKTISADQSIGIHPHRNHGREIKRSDSSYYAQRLGKGIDINSISNLFAEGSFDQLRYPAGKLNHFQTSNHLTQGIIVGFPMFAADDPGKFI